MLVDVNVLLAIFRFVPSLSGIHQGMNRKPVTGIHEFKLSVGIFSMVRLSCDPNRVGIATKSSGWFYGDIKLFVTQDKCFW